MLPVTQINGKNIGNGEKGSIFKKLISEWSKIVGIDIPKQIKDFNNEIEQIEGPTPYRFK